MSPRIAFHDETPRCYACHRPLKPDEPQRKAYWDAPSGTGSYAFVHEDCFKAMGREQRRVFLGRSGHETDP
ncbi:hypothetical protein GA0115259_100432 [Streptomyces sp. MnatMP-M17]|nr:hypothetical protein GA0115259_100432 [Streptomyces sp. MnatMP-M17]